MSLGRGDLDEVELVEDERGGRVEHVAGVRALQTVVGGPGDIVGPCWSVSSSGTVLATAS